MCVQEKKKTYAEYRQAKQDLFLKFEEQKQQAEKQKTTEQTR